MMEDTWHQAFEQKKRFYKWASALALITIFYKILEGCVSLFFGLQDGTMSLFGFGMDSFIEVISGIRIWHMVKHGKLSDPSNQNVFEKKTLQIAGRAFYLLAVGLVVTSLIAMYRGNRPETTFWGVIISVVSILSMWVLIHFKFTIGRQYNSSVLIADANCTKVCVYLSMVLFVSSIGYEVTGIGIIDSLGALGIACLSYREGKEVLERSKGDLTCCSETKCRSAS